MAAINEKLNSVNKSNYLFSGYPEQEKVWGYLMDKEDKDIHIRLGNVIVRSINHDIERFRRVIEVMTPSTYDCEQPTAVADISGKGDFATQQYQTIELGTYKYKIKTELGKMLDNIEDSEYILYLSDNYDNNGSLVPSLPAYNNAILFLVNFSNFLYEKWELYLDLPTITAARDGSIDLSWRSEPLEVGMLINFHTDGIKNQYYCYRSNRQHERKGFLKEPFDELNDDNKELFFWMKNNLAKLWS